MTLTPISLLERLRNPTDADAWNRFVQLYTPLLFAWSKRLGLQDADAADLLQDVFVLVHRAMPTFVYRPGKSFRAWLHTVTLNVWRNRRQKLQPQLLASIDVEQSDPALDLEEAEYRALLVHRALQIIRTDFAPTTWQACWEAVVSGRAPSAIAQELNISVDSVYAAKMRVLQRLREELRGLWD